MTALRRAVAHLLRETAQLIYRQPERVVMRLVIDEAMVRRVVAEHAANNGAAR